MRVCVCSYDRYKYVSMWNITEWVLIYSGTRTLDRKIRGISNAKGILRSSVIFLSSVYLIRLPQP